MMQPFLTDLISWKGPKDAKKLEQSQASKMNTPKKLSQRDEFLLTLMRLRLGLLNEDLAQRFRV